MKNINNSDAEKMLLTGKSIDELIQIKIEEDYKTLLNKPKPKEVKIENIANVSAENVFSKNSVFKVFNKKTGLECFINGIQAESMLGMQEKTRESIQKGITKAFVTDEAYVEFVYAKTFI